MKLLVTAGPTREFIDDVRFISNPSSGKMGFAVAAEAARRGHEVTLVAGPVELETPKGVRRVNVVSARDMGREVVARFGRCDAVVMTAAVSDYRPAVRARGKVKKLNRPTTLRLAPTPDILAGLGRAKDGRVLVGFALEVRDELENAIGKLRAKRLDMIVANRPGTFGSDRIRATVITSEGRVRRFRPMKKQELAVRLVRMVEERLR